MQNKKAAGCSIGVSRRSFLASGLLLPSVALGSFGPQGQKPPTGAMKLSCLPVTYFDPISKGQMALSAWMDFAADLKLDGVECGPLLIQPLGPATPSEFRRLAESRNLAVSNYSSYSDFTNPDPDARKREIEAMLKNIQIARKVGAPSIRALTGQQRIGLDPGRAAGWIVESIRRVAEKADAAGLRLNIENHTKAFTWTSFDFAIKSEVFLQIMESLKDAPVGVQFDIANPLVAGEDALALFEKVKSRIGYIHANDVRQPGIFEFVPVGSGIAPIREVLMRLSRSGYAGWISIEEASRTGREGFRQAVRYMRESIQASMQQ
jgi:sugar phosphate isomerase/epimerase